AIAAQRARHLCANGHCPNWRCVSGDRGKRAIQPAIFGNAAGCPRLHRVLRFEMRAIAVRRAGGVDDGELPGVPERLQRLQRWMQAEAAVEIEGTVVLARWLDGDRRAQLVVALLEVRDDDVQAVGGA